MDKRSRKQRHPSAAPRRKGRQQGPKLWKQELFPDELKPPEPLAEPEPAKPIPTEELPPPVLAGDIIEDILEVAPVGEGVQRIAQTPKRSYKELLEWLTAFVVVLVVALAITRYIAEPIRVDGHSMENTLSPNEYVLVSKYEYLVGPPERFDVVSCRYPAIRKVFVKRVIGMPGETVALRGGALFIDGRFLEQPFDLSPDPDPPDFGPITVPPEHYFVMGDNRGNSQDSRDPAVGPLPAASLTGHVLRVLYPFSVARPIPDSRPTAAPVE